MRNKSSLKKANTNFNVILKESGVFVMAEQRKVGSAARKRSFSGEMAGVFLLAGFPQLTRSGHRLVRVPPLATAGFCRAHFPMSVLPANRHLFFFRFAMCRPGRGHPPHHRTGIRKSSRPETVVSDQAIPQD
jgi:hypothetical protein